MDAAGRLVDLSGDLQEHQPEGVELAGGECLELVDDRAAAVLLVFLMFRRELPPASYRLLAAGAARAWATQLSEQSVGDEVLEKPKKVGPKAVQTHAFAEDMQLEGLDCVFGIAPGKVGSVVDESRREVVDVCDDVSTIFDLRGNLGFSDDRPGRLPGFGLALRPPEAALDPAVSLVCVSHGAGGVLELPVQYEVIRDAKDIADPSPLPIAPLEHPVQIGLGESGIPTHHDIDIDIGRLHVCSVVRNHLGRPGRPAAVDNSPFYPQAADESIFKCHTSRDSGFLVAVGFEAANLIGALMSSVDF